MRRIVMTGGLGFVGRHLAAAIKASFPGSECTILARTCSPTKPVGWDLMQVELTDEDQVFSSVRQLRPDMVVHLAGQAAPSNPQSVDIWKSNTFATLLLATAIARFAPQSTVLFSSSGAVYGGSPEFQLLSEATSVHPRDVYSVSKYAAEGILEAVLPESCRLIIARPFNHTGPGQDERFALSAFAAQIARIEAGLCVPRLLVGNLKPERDFLHVDDVIEAYIRLLKSDALPSRVTVNVASGKGFKMDDLLKVLRRLSHREFEIITDQKKYRSVDVPFSVGDPTYISRLTGWTPRYSLECALSQLLNGWREAV